MTPLTAICSAMGLPEPVEELRFDPVRRWRWDYAWPEYRLALEIQGGTWTSGRHSRGKGYKNDVEKLNAGQLAGWLVLWATTEQVQSGEAMTWVEQALKTRGWKT